LSVVADDVFNQYAYLDSSPLAQANALRRHNLRLYLSAMLGQKPDLLLVGEAPGYRGCRLTGIPFTSEHIILNNPAGLELFGDSTRFRKTCESPKVEREATATMVWQATAALRPLPLFWNAFPFHPHRASRPQSNRPPRANELAAGLPFIEALVEAYAIERVIAVGKKAASSLARTELPYTLLRHPSHGGQREFQEGLASLVNEA
jgi:uracil-DNA glycosylase